MRSSRYGWVRIVIYRIKTPRYSVRRLPDIVPEIIHLPFRSRRDLLSSRLSVAAACRHNNPSCSPVPRDNLPMHYILLYFLHPLPPRSSRVRPTYSWSHPHPDIDPVVAPPSCYLHRLHPLSNIRRPTSQGLHRSNREDYSLPRILPHWRSKQLHLRASDPNPAPNTP